MLTDDNQTYGNHFAMYKNIEYYIVHLKLT